MLGVPPLATDADIKAAYRALAKRLHPDVSDEVACLPACLRGYPLAVALRVFRCMQLQLAAPIAWKLQRLAPSGAVAVASACQLATQHAAERAWKLTL